MMHWVLDRLRDGTKQFADDAVYYAWLILLGYFGWRLLERLF